jgi:hypothetical protein
MNRAQRAEVAELNPPEKPDQATGEPIAKALDRRQRTGLACTPRSRPDDEVNLSANDWRQKAPQFREIVASVAVGENEDI